MSSLDQVLIIGCGIAGPILALLLKRKGYKPIVFEKVGKLGDAGASLMINPNGNKVFGLLGIDEKLHELSIPIAAFQDYTASGKSLGNSDLPAGFRERHGFETIGVKRTDLNLLLRDMLVEEGIEVREGWTLERIEESHEEVIAHFNSGRSASGCFLCGCDGIKAASRSLVLGIKGLVEASPEYTGLSQTAGISPTPPGFQNTPSLRNWYGDVMHVICYPVSSTHTSWAITRAEREQTKETWRLYSTSEVEDQKQILEKQLQGFNSEVFQLVRDADRITKFGLFDRRGLDAGQWFSQRCILVGDAAHPTSPHLGQGANQALEDCYHLSTTLPNLAESQAEGHTTGPTTEQLSTIFQRYAELRQPRTSRLVQGARSKGEQRVAKASAERDEAIKSNWKNEVILKQRNDELFLGHPYYTTAEQRLASP